MGAYLLICFAQLYTASSPRWCTMIVFAIDVWPKAHWMLHFARHLEEHEAS